MTVSVFIDFMLFSLGPLGIPKDLQIQITSSRTAVAWWRGVKSDRTVMRGKFLGYKVLNVIMNVILFSTVSFHYRDQNIVTSGRNIMAL